MILDSRSPAEDRIIEYDVLIAGAGPAGITLALELRDLGLRIGLLESGGEDFDPDTQFLNDGTVTGHSDGVDLAAIRLRMLGGATNHWGGRCVPMDRIDFERAPLSGLTGWPVSYDAMQPYYGRAHSYFDIGPAHFDPLQIGGITQDDLLLADAEDLRTVVVRESTLQYGPAYRDALDRARDIDLWLWSNVVALETDADGAVSAVQTQALEGPSRRFTARFVVLACGAVENARQLLVQNADNETRLGNAGGFVGQCYMDHPAAGAAFLWPNEPVPPSPYWDLPEDSDGTRVHLLWAPTEEAMARDGLANIQYYLRPFDEVENLRVRQANSGWYALRNMAKWVLGRDRDEIVLSDAYCGAINNADVMAGDLLGLIGRDEPTHRILLLYEAEQQPTRDNAVTLSEERDALGQLRADLNWAPSDADRDSILATTTLIGQAVGAQGFGRLEFEDHFEEPYWGSYTSWHQMGTTRMATNPEDGVTDPDGRVHGSPNLYMAGGSVMPTGGRANPTLTIVALTIRLADHLKQRLAA